MSGRAGIRALFVPCRRGSERVPDKNTRPFAGHAGGLLGLKLDQLAHVDVDRVVVDSNDPIVLDYARLRAASWAGRAALDVRERPDHLGRADTTTDALITYALDAIDCDELAWTHVTSPFCGADTYARALAAWDAARLSAAPDAPDSLVAVTTLHTFVWAAGEGAPVPMNYIAAPGARWPRTQDVRPLHDVCSALFLVPRALGRARGDRLGERPLRVELTRVEAIDIDWPEDFSLAEALWPRYGPGR